MTNLCGALKPSHCISEREVNLLEKIAGLRDHLAAANKRIMELEEDLRHSKMAATAEAKWADELNAKLTAERELSDKLLAALEEIPGNSTCKFANHIVSDSIAEVASIRANAQGDEA